MAVTDELAILHSNRVTVGVGRTGAMLWPVRFREDDREFEPMHRAPWAVEPDASDLPMLQNLAGDFLCAPFGANDVLLDESRDHGTPANGVWQVREATVDRIELELAGLVAGARLTKEVRLRDGHPVVYQRHVFERIEADGDVRDHHAPSPEPDVGLPIGHHAMLKAPEGEQLNLSFSSFAWGGTPPHPVEPDPDQGRSRLLYPQRIPDLRHARLADGSTVDLTRYPALLDSEEILQLVTSPDLDFAWSAAVAPKSGWVWFAVRPNGPLTATMLWMSNGGRDYEPFSGRHRRVLGMEEVTSFFHLGHRASTGPNAISEAGFRTAVSLGERLVIHYAFGCVAAPAGFTQVADLVIEDDALILFGDEENLRIDVPFDAGFLGK